MKKKLEGFVILSPKLLTCDSEWGEGSRRCSWGWLPGLGFVARAGFRYTSVHTYVLYGRAWRGSTASEWCLPCPPSMCHHAQMMLDGLEYEFKVGPNYPLVTTDG